MKTIKLLPILFALMTLTMASTCDSDDDNNWTNPNQNNVTITQVRNTAQDGSWRIVYFFDTDHEDTNHFTNYGFTFGQDGTLTATNGTNTYTGSWSVTNSHSGDDDSGHNSSDVDFNIGFSTPANFAELTEDWHIVTYSATRIELIHVSGGNGGTDHLIFEKN